MYSWKCGGDLAQGGCIARLERVWSHCIINMFSLGKCYEAYVLFIEMFFMVTKSGNESLHENNWREGGQDGKIQIFSGLIKT